MINMEKTVSINIRVKEIDKRNMEATCKELGISMSTAFVIFMKQMVREKSIPFTISADPFYSEENMNYLKQKVKDFKDGKLQFQEHDLIEE